MNCPICREPIVSKLQNSIVLYDSTAAAERHDDDRRAVVHGRCLPSDSVRVTCFAFARPEAKS